VAIVTFYLLLFDTVTGTFTGRWGAMLLPIVAVYYAINVGIGLLAAGVYLVKYLVAYLTLSDKIFIYVLIGMYVFGAVAALFAAVMYLLPASLSFLYWVLVIPAFLSTHGAVAYMIHKRALQP
jgi:hypothetical protein